jgi:predicted nucleic acid-binding protein
MTRKLMVVAGGRSRDRAVLVDTGAWLAAFHGRDQYHDAAAGELRRLRTERVQLLVTDLILAELHLHLVHGLGPRRAAGHLGTLKSDPLIEEAFADRELQDAAMSDWIRRYADHPFTFTDAASFALMKARGIRTAFTFDRHFRIAGFRTIPVASEER